MLFFLTYFFWFTRVKRPSRWLDASASFSINQSVCGEKGLLEENRNGNDARNDSSRIFWSLHYAVALAGYGSNLDFTKLCSVG